MSVVELLDLTTFSPSERRAPEPATAIAAPTDDDDDVWDIETADETPEDLEALILAARDEIDSV